MKKFSIEIKWGLIFTLALILWTTLEMLLGFHGERIKEHPVVTVFFAIPAIALYVLALIDKKKNYYDGSINWLQGFITGSIIGIVVAVLSPISQYIVHTFISPDFLENAREASIEFGAMSKEDAAEYFTLSNYIITSIVSSVIMGIITSAIVSVFVAKVWKKK